jgi:hypothetical protein
MQLIKLGKSLWINPDGITHIEDEKGTYIIYFNSHGFMEIPTSHVDYYAVTDFIAGLVIKGSNSDAYSDAQCGVKEGEPLRGCGSRHPGECIREPKKA